MAYYPVFLQVEGRRCVVIGGDSLAESKVVGLLEAGAFVEVVDPEPTATIVELAGSERIRLATRRYRHGDLAGAFIAICARRERSLIDEISAEATARNVPLNVIDETNDCSFIAPAVVRRGDLVVAISTSGRAPALAVRLRQRLEAELGEHHAEFLDIAARLRSPLAELYPDFETRRAIWYRLVDSEVLDLLERGDRARALEVVGEVVGEVAGFAPVSSA